MEFWQQTQSISAENFGCHVASAGYADSASFNADCARFRHDYQIIYLYKGTGQVCLNGIWHTIGDNTLLFYHPMDYQEYSFPQEENRELYWLYFDNISETEIAERFHIPDGILFEVLDPEDILYVFRKIIEELKSHHSGKALMLSLYTGQLLLLLSRYVVLHPLSEKNTEADHMEAVQVIRKDIESNYMSFVKVHEYAARCGLSTTQFIKLFHQQTGMTPIAYRQKIRLKQAEHLLLTSNKTIQEIANCVGFQDALYFSKVFQKKTGLSPSTYRKQYTSVP